MILFLSKDLFFIPVIKSACEKCDAGFVSAPNWTSPRIQQLESSEVRACVLDLAGMSTEELTSWIPEIRTRFPLARLIAFGPHVHTASLATARENGCDEVLTRGQFSSQIDNLVPSWEFPS